MGSRPGIWGNRPEVEGKDCSPCVGVLASVLVPCVLKVDDLACLLESHEPGQGSPSGTLKQGMGLGCRCHQELTSNKKSCRVMSASCMMLRAGPATIRQDSHAANLFRCSRDAG